MNEHKARERCVQVYASNYIKVITTTDQLYTIQSSTASDS